MEFQVLGPVAVADGDGVPMVRAPMSRVLLAVLLARAGEPVPADALADALWRGAPPSPDALRWHVHQLRSDLGPDRVERALGGVRLRVEPGELDAATFTERLAAGRALLREGEPVEAALELRQGLELWRGDAYDGLDDVPALEGERRRLQALRQSALEQRLDADLQAGRLDEVATELAGLIAADPLRERLRALQIDALVEAGRRAEALTAYDDARQVLARELGVEPGAELQLLHRRLVDHVPETAAPPAAGPGVDARPPAPSELPPRLATFTGRGAELRDVVAAVRGAAESLVVISGPGGAGKSALAVEAAHRLSADFPDGALYVDLTGATPGMVPREPLSVLHRFSRSLGDDRAGGILDPDEAAARFRTRTAGRRLLIVLDNAADAAQVRPLLPGGDGAAVLVTCRRPLGTLEGAHRVALAPMTEDEALRMLARSVTDGRITADPAATRDLARLCEHLPLALCVAGARLAARPDWSVADLVARLADRSRRLGELSLDDRAVRASLAVSADDVDDVAAGVFLELALLELPDVPVGALVASTGLNGPRLADALEELRLAHLLDVAGDRLYLHDLARAFAGERARERVGQADRALAVRRTFHWYVASARNALALTGRGQEHRRHRGLASADLLVRGADLVTEREAEEWLLAETGALVAAAWQAVRDPRLVSEALALTAVVVPALASRGIRHERLELVDAVLASGLESADAAWLHVDAGNVKLQLGDDEAAIRHGRAAARLAEEAGDDDGVLRAKLVVGNALAGLGRLEEALAWMRPALDLALATDQLVTACDCANNLADALMSLGRPAEAVPMAERALALSRRLGRRRHEAYVTVTLGEALLLSGSPGAGLAALDEAVGRLVELGDELPQPLVNWRRAQAFDALGRGREAREARRRCLDALVALERMGAAEAEELLAQERPEAPTVLMLPY